MSDCLNNIIGLSTTVCPCFDDSKPNDYNVSNSGYYLDQLEGINLQMVNCLDDCSDGNLWELMSTSVNQAKMEFTTDLMAFISKNTRLKQNRFKGIVGESSWNSTLPQLGNYHGLRISPCREVRGGYIYISGITTLFDTTISGVNVEIWDNVNEDALYTFAIDGNQNRKFINDLKSEKIKLPLWSDKCSGEDLEYYIVYDLNGFLPLNNKIECGCPGKTYGWWGTVDVYGIYGDDTNNLESFSTDQYMNGLCLHAETVCDISNVICDAISDVCPTPIQMVIAKTIQYKAGQILLNKIGSSGAINRYTLLEREHIWGKRNHYTKEYMQRIEWLSEEIDLSGNDCIICDDEKFMAKRTIIS